MILVYKRKVPHLIIFYLQQSLIIFLFWNLIVRSSKIYFALRCLDAFLIHPYQV